MDEVNVASKLQKYMKAQLANLTTTITSGGVDNMALSKNRAKATADYLKSKVKNPDVKFVVTAASIKEPIGSNKTVKGMSSNRRVDIILPKPRIKTGGAPLAVGKGRGPFGGSADKQFG